MHSRPRTRTLRAGALLLRWRRPACFAVAVRVGEVAGSTPPVSGDWLLAALGSLVDAASEALTSARAAASDLGLSVPADEDEGEGGDAAMEDAHAAHGGGGEHGGGGSLASALARGAAAQPYADFLVSIVLLALPWCE
jgi:hypothetical protein